MFDKIFFMRKTLLFIALLGSTATFGQMTQTNEPNIGDTRTMYVCDSFATNYEGTTGTGVTWDYSALSAYLGYENDITIGDATLAANALDFPTSVKTVEVQNATTTYFNSTATERVSQGFVYYEPSFGEIKAILDVNEATLMPYPFNVGDYHTDYFEGTLYFDFQGVPMTPAVTGNMHAWIDGEGTLLLPDGSSVSNVIRYKMIDTAETNISFFGDLEIIRKQFEYYDLTATNTIPLFTMTEIKIQPPGGSPLTDPQTIVLSSAQPTTFVGIEEKDAVSFSVYPNPTSDVVSISGEFENDATIAIYDQGGRLLKTLPLLNQTEINLSAFDTGMYLLKVSNNGHTTTKTVVKR